VHLRNYAGGLPAFKISETCRVVFACYCFVEVATDGVIGEDSVET
jgi:hypothetical protein